MVRCFSILGFFLAFLTSTFACQMPSRPNSQNTYSVAVTYLPRRLDPRHNRINVYHYMILQLYEPLLRIDADKVCSAFLNIERTQSLSRNFDCYRLCLRDRVHFTDGTPVRVEDLISSLRDTHASQETLPPLESIVDDGNCVQVRLGRRDPQYLEQLTTAASTVLKRGTENERLPVGLGPYVIDAWDDAHVHMTFRGTKPHVDFPQIDFVKVRDLDEALDKQLLDLNLMYWEPRRLETLAAWSKLHHPMIRSYALIASIPDDTLRKRFAACFNKARYLEQAMSLELQLSRGFLHPRLPGSDVDFDQIQANMGDVDCDFEGPKPRIQYINQVYPDHDALQRFFREESKRLPVEVDVIDRQRSDLIDMFTARETMLFTIGLEGAVFQAADVGEVSVFFDSFVREFRYIPQPIHAVSKAVRAALSTKDRQTKASYYKEAHKELLASGYVIPLGQLPPTLVYPHRIKQVEFADSVIGYPRVDWIVARQRWWWWQ